MAPKGRKRSAQALQSECEASYRMMARVSDESDFKAKKGFKELAKRDTPYGCILKSMDLLRDDNSYFNLVYACPFALFYILCEASPDFFSLLFTFWGFATIEPLVFYMDETRPGNILRPEMARAMHGIFWGIANLPDWYRGKSLFWIPFAHVPSKEMKRIRGGASAVYLKMCEVFWPTSLHLHNFERTGVETRGRSAKFKYGFMIVDEKCEKEVWGIKGAAGLKCCINCVNCVRTKRPIMARSGLVSFSEADMSKFERNTPEMLSAALDHLAAQKGVLNKKQFALLEQQLGLVYDNCVVLYSPYRGMLNLPLSRYSDWFHDLLASGGVYQLLVNEVVLDVLEETQLSLVDIDEFQVGVRLPQARLPKTFFRDRVVEKRGAHLRCFAAETISAVVVLCFMFASVFDDPAVLTQQRRLCTLARASLEILLAGDSAVRLADRLDSVLEELQVLLLTLYPWCDIPKVHLMRHIRDGFDTFKRNFACAAGERLHRRTKTLGRFSFNLFQNTILLRTVYAILEASKDKCNFVHTALEGKARTLVVLGERRESWASVLVGRKRLRARDVVHWVLDGRRHLGRVRGIVTYEGKAFASVAALSPLPDGTCSCAVLREMVVECVVLEQPLPYIEICTDTFRVLMPV